MVAGIVPLVSSTAVRGTAWRVYGGAESIYRRRRRLLVLPTGLANLPADYVPDDALRPAGSAITGGDTKATALVCAGLEDVVKAAACW